ncbi:transcriptional regulator [Paenibacillus sp. H1-7]|uniref:winged helix-turn-helix transcriptional regulator n=1 Tax=Paenibacillus sp. H1-7 TaxID=2282849 RepID=UPI001EF98328|nr:winged-helix domain-containing protein [Paenibacillus sp. H1-7]ULL18885.1 transcriptional regulator [Paenibacillus sp. H1-7]
MQQQFREEVSVRSNDADLPIGAYCETTHSIVIISPFPHALHELVRELTAKCYDVLVFHHLDEQALAALRIDLLIMDATYGTSQLRSRPAAITAPALLLVKRTEQLSEQQAASSYDESLVWPAGSAPAEAVLPRIQSLLSGSGRQPEERSDQVQRKDLVVDFKKMSVHLGNARVDLTKTEFDLLRVLLETNGTVLSRQEMMDRIWGDQYFGGSNTVDVHVKSLRHKLKDNPKAPQYIETVRGVGYRLAD